MESNGDLKSMYADPVENLNCPICHDKLKENRDLACGHTYCLECVRKLVTINVSVLCGVSISQGRSNSGRLRLQQYSNKNIITTSTMEECLICSFCHDIVRDPRTLDCGHTCCLKCPREMVKSNDKGWTSDRNCYFCQEKTSIPSPPLQELEAIMNPLGASSTEQASATPRQQQGTTEATDTRQIFVRDLSGHSTTIRISLSDTADALKRQVAKKTGIPANVQRLIYGSKQLEGLTPLEEYGIGNFSNIELVLRHDP